jgi:predicted enzyme related to lactoylglutathione lyase
MFHGISHIDMQVTDLENSCKLWTDIVQFSISSRGEGYAILDSGNVEIRLIEVASVEHTTTIRLSVADVHQTYQHLVKSGLAPKYEPMNTPDLQKIACVTDRDGNSIIVWRALTEDEWGFVPELPKTGEWHPDAEELLVRLLKYVPAFFRMLVRRKVTRVVEQLARDENTGVTREHVIKGYITSSAKVTRYRLIEPLKSENINPDDYKTEFDYE